MLGSEVCRREHFDSDWYAKFADKLPLGVYGIEAGASPRRPHRKAWEWCAILQALEERDMLRPGRSGAGFAVGREPLPAAMAACGVSVLATDQAATQDAAAWSATSQHADSLEAIFRPELIDRAQFEAHVRFRPADMRNLNLPWGETFDFIWSSCSIEHLGGLQQGIDFVLSSTDLLKPGGVAVHTTEYNVSSNMETITTGDSVIYRKQDIEALDGALRLKRCGLSRCDFFAGDHADDLNYDMAPYGLAEHQHIKLMLGAHVTTSMVLIVNKC